MVSLEAAHANEETLLAHLKEKAIPYDRHTHPVVLTVDEQAKHLAGVDGALSKNLLLKDKKGRFILVSALASTTVDLKLLSQRLGLGKGGIRMAPNDSLAAVLQVPEGCVTPMALFHAAARNLPLLLDQNFRNQQRLLFHPLSNDASIGMERSAFEQFLGSVGRTPDYVDLEANVAVGKDQPPDLAPLLQGVTASSAPGEPQPENDKGGSKQPATAKGAAKPAAAKPAPKAAGPPGDDVASAAQAILGLIGSTKSGEGAAGEARKEGALEEELQHILVMFKNAAYTHGFSAAKQCVSQRTW